MFTGAGAERLPPQIEQLQSLLMLLLIISGSYLYLIPYFTKWQRNRRKKIQQRAEKVISRQVEFSHEINHETRR
jgi:competence protein ComGC